MVVPSRVAFGHDPPRPVHPDSAADLAFVAPGLVHQFGNLFLTVQGHAVYLEPPLLPRAQSAILGACTRGASTLSIFRHLVGGAGPERIPARDAVAQVGELLRVPVREAGHQLECREPVELPRVVVDLASFVSVMVSSVRSLLAAVPTGVSGVVSVRLSPVGVGGGAGLNIAFRATAGSLPFPLAMNDAASALRNTAARCRWPHEVELRADGFLLLLPPVTAVLDANREP